MQQWNNVNNSNISRGVFRKYNCTHIRNSFWILKAIVTLDCCLSLIKLIVKLKMTMIDLRSLDSINMHLIFDSKNTRFFLSAAETYNVIKYYTLYDYIHSEVIRM